MVNGLETSGTTPKKQQASEMVAQAIFNIKKQQASKMVAQTLVRPAPPLLPPPCPASINPSSSPYQSALANDIISQVNRILHHIIKKTIWQLCSVPIQVSGGPAKLKLKTATSLFLCSPQGLSFLHSRIPVALERWLPTKFHIYGRQHFIAGTGRADLIWNSSMPWCCLLPTRLPLPSLGLTFCFGWWE